MKGLLLHWVLPPLVLLAGIGGAYLLISGRKASSATLPPPPPPLVRTATTAFSSPQLTVSSQGTVEPRTATLLSAEVTARVLEIAPALHAGGFFAAGEVLVRLDPTDYQLAVQRAEAEVARAERVVTWEEAEARAALDEWRRLSPSAEPPALVARLPQVAEAKAMAKAAGAALEQAKRDLERTAVQAPYTGRVRQASVDVGQLVARGTPLAHLYATDALEIRLPLLDAELAHLDLPLGARAELSPAQSPAVTIHATFAGKEWQWPGHIVRTEADLDPRTRLVHLVALVKDPNAASNDSNGSHDRPPLLPGMFVRAAIAGRRHERVIVIPRDALRGEDQVWVVDAERRLRMRTVHVLRRERDQVIVSGGLDAGQQLCVSPLDAPTDGMRVRVDEAAAAATGR